MKPAPGSLCIVSPPSHAAPCWFVCHAPGVGSFQGKCIQDVVPLNDPPSFQVAKEPNTQKAQPVAWPPRARAPSFSPAFCSCGSWVVGALLCRNHSGRCSHRTFIPGTECTQCPDFRGWGRTGHRASEEGTEERTNEQIQDHLDICSKLRPPSTSLR